MDGNMFNGLFAAIQLGAWVLLFSVPLGIWKLVEIVIWLFGHVTFV